MHKIITIIDIPPLWDKDYSEKLYSELFNFLETYFYDGPLERKNLINTIMLDTKGQLNPKVVSDIVDEYMANNRDRVQES